MQLSQNQKNFSEFFFAFPESTYNLEYFYKTVQPQRGFPSQIIDWKKWSFLTTQKA